MDPPSDAIAAQQSRNGSLGADPSEIRGFLGQAAAALEQANRELARLVGERAALQAALGQASAELAALRGELAEARGKLGASQAEAALIARTLVTAQKTADDLIRTSTAQGEQMLAEARAAADDTMRSAHRAAADLLRATRERAREAVDAADRAAVARIADGRMEGDRLLDEARNAVRDAQQEVRRLVAGLEAFLAAKDDLSAYLGVLARKYADSLEAIGRIHVEVAGSNPPSFRHLMDELPGPGRTTDGATTPLPRISESGAGRPPVAPAAGVPLPSPTAAASPAPPPTIHQDSPRARFGQNGRGAAPGAASAGEVVVSPVDSYLQAAKLVIEMSRLKGVRAARLRSFSNATLTIDVVADGSVFTAAPPALIGGVPHSVVDATERRLVLRAHPNGRPALRDAAEITP